MAYRYEDYFGIYYFMGTVFTVKQVGDQLVSSIAGVPDGYEIIMISVGGDSFEMQGGPIDDSTIRFVRDASGAVTGIDTGVFSFEKIEEQALEDLPIVERLLPPEYNLTMEKREQFDSLLKSSLEEANGDWIDYDMPYPVHEFVQYITTQDRVIFHGSNKTDIETFKPVRKSVELRDETGRGNVQGVYGTHDGLWAMFFSVVDRKRLQGSIRNGVMYFHNRSGDRLAVYNFSINQEQLAEQPYTPGALYLLPRETFVRLMLTPESYANEWASDKPVQPCARLLIQPDDFPFLEQISGHDDSELLRLEAIGKEIRKNAISASLVGDRFVVTLPVDAPVVYQLEEYVATQRVMSPAADYSVEQGGEIVRLVISSLPPAMQQTLAESYMELLD